MQSALAKQIVLSIALFVCQGFAGAQPNSSTSSQLDELRAQGYQALYNLDYNTARKYFREMIQTAPDNPVGAECLATSIWLQQLNEQWELKGSLYSNKSYAEEDDKPDQQPGIDFRGFIRQTKQLSQARLKRDPRDQEALYLLGAAEGLEAAYFAGIERKFMSALRSAQDSVEHHRALLQRPHGPRPGRGAHAAVGAASILGRRSVERYRGANVRAGNVRRALRVFARHHHARAPAVHRAARSGKPPLSRATGDFSLRVRSLRRSAVPVGSIARAHRQSSATR